MEVRQFQSKIAQLVALMREDAPELPLQTLHVFLTISQDEGIGAQEIMNRLGMPRSSTSRNLNQLADGFGANGSNSPLNWLEWRLSPTDARSKVYYLTAKGRELREKWSAVL